MLAEAADTQGAEQADKEDLEWHFLQCFGQPSAAETAPAADILSALQFNKDGQFLATGDQGGRIVLLQQSCNNSGGATNGATASNWMLPMEYSYLTEFQAHSPDFDYLKSIEISEKINSISWLQGTGTSQLLLSANDKQAKLWKIYEKEVASIVDYNHGAQAAPHAPSFGTPPPALALPRLDQLRVPRVVDTTRSYDAKCRRSFCANTHLYFIHSVSVCSDQATFMTADDLSIYIWDLERSNSSLQVLNIRPEAPDETETLRMLTRAAFHPTDPNLLAFSTSRSVLSMIDVRQKDHSGSAAIEFETPTTNRNLSMAFTELVSAGSSFQFAPDGRHAVTRDYMHGSIWDVRQQRAPLRTFEVHEHLWSRLMDVYENESIFDHLGCAVSPSGQHAALGSYCELFVFHLFSDTFTSLKACGSPIAMNDLERRQATDETNFSWKVENIAWHPSQPLVVATALNSLYTYCARRVASGGSPAGP